LSKLKKAFKFRKVVWISDRAYPKYNGGAERTDFVIREAGRKLGLKIDWTNDLPDRGYDLIVISNIHLWREEKARELLLEDTPTLFFSHDPLIHGWYPTAIRKAFASVFMSPAHRDFYTKKFHIKRMIVQPHGLLDTERWYSKERKKDYYLYVGDLNPYKGVQNIYKWAEENPDKEVRVWGRNFAKFPFVAENFKYYGWLDEKKLPDTLAEALFSGCTIIGNENIGSASYDWPWDDLEAVKEILRKAPREFWYKVNKFYRKERR